MGKKQPQASFVRFRQLPAELRLMIWEASLPVRNIWTTTDWIRSDLTRCASDTVVKCEQWSRNRPAHLWTCHEARKVALERRPWKFEQINMLYIHSGLAWGIFYGRYWEIYVGRVRTLVLGTEWLYQKSRSVAVSRLFRFKQRELHLLDRHMQSIRTVFRTWHKRDPLASTVDKIVFVMATVRCRGPKWLFEDSGLVVLGFNDPRLVRALNYVASLWARRKAGSSQRAQRAVYEARERDKKLLPEWAAMKYPKLACAVSRLSSALKRLAIDDPFTSQVLKDGKLELAIAFEKKGGVPYWEKR